MYKDTQISVDLRTLGWQIRGIAYLIGNQKIDKAPPLDSDDLMWGVGQVLGELGAKVSQAADVLDSATSKD